MRCDQLTACGPLCLLLLLAGAAFAQDSSDWNSLAKLKPGDRIQIALKGQKPVTAAFQSWSLESLSAGTISAARADVKAVSRFREGKWGRGKRTAVFAAVGFAGGFALGAAVTGCGQDKFVCISRPEGGAIVGAVTAALGAAAGALWPSHTTERIYQAR